jgi:hypothetical protein
MNYVSQDSYMTADIFLFWKCIRRDSCNPVQERSVSYRNIIYRMRVVHRCFQLVVLIVSYITVAVRSSSFN